MVCKFGVSLRITTDRGRQFEYQLFQILKNIIGTHIHTILYYLSSNRLVERFYGSLQAVIRCCTTERLVDILHTILLGLRSSIKKDLQASVVKLVHGKTLSLPRDFFHFQGLRRSSYICWSTERPHIFNSPGFNESTHWCYFCT